MDQAFGGRGMDQHVSADIIAGLAQARAKPKDRRHRLRIEVEGEVYPVIKAWDGGFSVSVEDCPNLRGFVDLFDGSRHLASCLVMCSKQEAGTMRYEYKRSTKAKSSTPRDFEIEIEAPVGYLPG